MSWESRFGHQNQRWGTTGVFLGGRGRQHVTFWDFCFRLKIVSMIIFRRQIIREILNSVCHGNQSSGARITCGTFCVCFRCCWWGDGLFSGELIFCQKCWRDNVFEWTTVGQDTVAGSFTSPPGGNRVHGSAGV